MAAQNKLNARKYLFLIITFGGLILLWAVNLLFFSENPGFIGISLHPYLLLVVIVASIDGFFQAMVTAFIVSVSYGLCIFFKTTFFSCNIVNSW